jgi:hypothetical protein
LSQDATEGIGVRRAAFGSKDSLAKDTNTELFDIHDVQRIMSLILSISSLEQVTA